MELKKLIDRVKAATVPDRKIEEALVEMAYSRREAMIHKGHDLAMHRYTASIDAALALVERCLPGCASERTSWRSHYRCTLIETGEGGWHNGGRHFRINADSEASEPLAIILALLTALDQKEENK